MLLSTCAISSSTPAWAPKVGMTRQEVELKDVDGDSYPDHVLSTKRRPDDGCWSTRPAAPTCSRPSPTRWADPSPSTIPGRAIRPPSPTRNGCMGSVDVNDGRPGDGPTHLLTHYTSTPAVSTMRSSAIFLATIQSPSSSATPACWILRPIPRSSSNPALDQQFPCCAPIERDYRNSTVFDKGLVAREALLNPDGSTFQESLNSYTCGM